jgi:nicotinate-nucleotide adenylyltransferase
VHLAVFGGTFDPPHNGHLALALFARELLPADRILISVSNNPLKSTCGASDRQRLAMAELLSLEVNRTGMDSAVSGWELQQQGPSYTVDLLRHIRSSYPDAHLTLVIGEDSYLDFPRWRDPEGIFALADVAVFRRRGDAGSDVLAEDSRVRCIAFEAPVSSTMVRELAAAGKSLRGIVPESVMQYILSEGLYRGA